ncbi:MAG: ABC transporter ATP-binding protein [Hungatella sp.]|nr:ABC transporter ATP-binding protein [Hungatella sp.]
MHKENDFSTIKDNLYAIKLVWKFSKKKMFCTFVYEIITYLEEVFVSAYFLKYVIELIDKHTDFFIIFRYILISGMALMFISLSRSYIQNVVYPLSENKIYRGIYSTLYKKASNVELECYENADFYNKYTMAIENTADKVVAVINNTAGLVSGIIASIAIFYSIYQIDSIAILFIAFPMIGNFVFGIMLSRNIMKRYEDSIVHQRIIKYINRVFYLSDFAKEIRTSNVYQLLKGKYMNAVGNLIKVVDAYSKKLILFDALKNIFSFPLMFDGVLLYGAYKAMIFHNISLAEMAVFTSVVVAATSIIMNLSNKWLELIKNGMYIKNLKYFFDYTEKIPEDYDGIVPDSKIETIEFRNVSFSYGQGDPTIINLSFIINGKSKVALVGHNGAGKSTIIKLLFRFYDPDQGEILVNEKNIKEYNLKEYRKLFASAFQDYQIFASTIKENILMGEKYENENKRVEEALKLVNAWKDVVALEHGTDTMMTKEFAKDGVVLSGGQCQKIIVARALAKDAAISVFDEPSSALDPIAEYNLFRSIMQKTMNKTVIFISHRLSSVLDADCIIMLENGRIIEQGTHGDLMKKKGVYADMYLKQASNYLAINDLRWQFEK